MESDEARQERAIEACVGVLLEACVALRAEVMKLPQHERESAAYRKFHALEEALQFSPELAELTDGIRARLAKRAHESEGAEFAIWLSNAMGWFPSGKRVPPVSSKRRKK